LIQQIALQLFVGWMSQFCATLWDASKALLGINACLYKVPFCWYNSFSFLLGVVTRFASSAGMCVF